MLCADKTAPLGNFGAELNLFALSNYFHALTSNQKSDCSRLATASAILFCAIWK